MLMKLSNIAKKHNVTRQSVQRWVDVGRGSGDSHQKLNTTVIDGVHFAESEEVEEFIQKTGSGSKNPRIAASGQMLETLELVHRQGSLPPMVRKQVLDVIALAKGEAR